MARIRYQSLLEYHFKVVPPYIVKAGKTFIDIKTADFRGASTDRVTAGQVASYFTRGHGQSGMRSLGSISGDWRQIDHLAKICLDWFLETGALELA